MVTREPEDLSVRDISKNVTKFVQKAKQKTLRSHFWRRYRIVDLSLTVFMVD